MFSLIQSIEHCKKNKKFIKKTIMISDLGCNSNIDNERENKFVSQVSKINAGINNQQVKTKKYHIAKPDG